MWKLEVKGSSEDVYRLLRQEFNKRYVSSVDGGMDDSKSRRFPDGKPLGLRTRTDPGVSEQFRRVLKSVQGMLNEFDGNISVSCSGTPGKSLSLKIEEV